MYSIHKYSKFIVLFLTLLCISACEDILDQDPVSDITSASFWETKDDFQAALVAAYSKAQNALGGNLFYWGDGRADGVTNHNGVGLAKDPVSSGTAYGVDWTELYTWINQVNLVIKNADATEVLSGDEKEQILGEAYFLRALAYFYGARIWGNMPVLTEGYDNFAQDLFPSNGAPDQTELVLQQVKEDVDQAIALLPFDDERGRATKGAAYALRANYNLWMGWKNNDNAFFTATVIDVDALLENTEVTYELIDDYQDIFGTNVTNEDVFVLKFGEQENNSSMREIVPENNISYSIAEDKLEQGFFIPIGGASMRYNVSEKLVNLFDTVDQRSQVVFIQQVFDIPPAHGLPVYWTRKYLGQATFSSPRIGQAVDHLRIYRVADVKLMKAEALTQLNNIEEAKAIVNEVRVRAYGSAYDPAMYGVQGNPTQTEMLDIVLNERFKELALEGKRWFDLVRTGKALTEQRDRLDAFTQPRPVATDADDLLWPISASSIISNGNIQQNPGY